MSYPNLSSSFISYTLTEEETLFGSILATGQKQCIQNQISNLAEQRISLRYLPDAPMTFVQQDAELQGQIIALRYLITLSDNAEASLLDLSNSSSS